jgi:hypothetical protein
MKRVSKAVSRYDITFAVQATPNYAAGDVVGGLITIADAVREGMNSGKILGAILTNDVAHAIDLELIFFGENPASTTFTENTALTVAPADMEKIIGRLSLTVHNSFAASSMSEPAVNQRPLPFELNAITGLASTSLYMVVLSGGVLNFGATTDLAGAIYIEHD